MGLSEMEKLLLQAQLLLPRPCVEKIETGKVNTGSLKMFEEFIYHSEFELALDELEALGLLNHCKEDFWEILSRIAQEMNLSQHVLRYEHHIRSLR